MKTTKGFFDELFSTLEKTFDWYKDIPVRWNAIASYCVAANGFFKTINPAMKAYIQKGDKTYTGSILPLDFRENHYYLKYRSFSPEKHEIPRATRPEYGGGFTHLLKFGSVIANNDQNQTIFREMADTHHLPKHAHLDILNTAIVTGFNGTIIHEATHSYYTPSMYHMLHDALIELNGVSHNPFLKDGVSSTLKILGPLLNVVEDVAMEAHIAHKYPSLFHFIRGKNLILFNPLSILEQLLPAVTSDALTQILITLPGVKVEDNVLDVITTTNWGPPISDSLELDKAQGAYDIATQARRHDITVSERIAIAVELYRYIIAESSGDSGSDSGKSDGIPGEEAGDSGSDSGDEGVPSEGSGEPADKEDSGKSGEPSIEQVIDAISKTPLGEPKPPKRVGSYRIEKKGDSIVHAMKSVVNEEGDIIFDDEVETFIENMPKDFIENNYSDEKMDQLKTDFGKQLGRARSPRTRYDHFNDRGGRVIPYRIARAGTDGKIYGRKTKTRRQKVDYVFWVLVDGSGSMGIRERYDEWDWATRLEAAFGVSWALYKSLAQAKIECSVLYHMSHTQGWYRDSNFDGLFVGKVTGPDIPYSRAKENLRMCMAVNDRNSDTHESYSRAFRSENMDGHAINYIGKHIILPHRTQLQKVLLVISDGEPAAPGYHGHTANKHTKEAVDRLRNNGVIVKSLSIAKDCEYSNNAIYGEEHNETANVDGLIDIAKTITGFN